MYGSWILQANHYIGCTLGWQIDVDLMGTDKVDRLPILVSTMGEKLLDIPKTELHAVLWPMLYTVPFKNGDWRIWSVPCVSTQPGCVILEQLIGRPLLHLWCHHYVLELVLAAAFGVRMGPSKAPGNPPVQAVAWTVGINWSGRLPSDYGDFLWWLCFHHS